MPKTLWNDAALAAWERGGGGSADHASRDPSGGGHDPCRPSLPAGYGAQEAWGFRNETGRVSYEFNRVYGPPNPRGVAHLVEGLCYWSVTWPTVGASGDVHPAGRWMTYADARRLWSSRLTFERFSSVVQMRADAPRLLHGPESD